MKILSYLPCDGWYFIYSGPSERVLSRVAVWAVVEVDGQSPASNPTTRVIGMISIRRTPGTGVPLSLEPVPEGEGCYVHADDLSQRERKILEKYRKGD
jgi:hypothetical protein